VVQGSWSAYWVCRTTADRKEARLNGGGRHEEDWGFYPDLARKPGNIRGQKRLVGRGNTQQRRSVIPGRTGGPEVDGQGARGGQRSRTTAVVVLIIAAVVILATGIALDQVDASGSGDSIDWELLPLPQDTSTSPTE